MSAPENHKLIGPHDDEVVSGKGLGGTVALTPECGALQSVVLARWARARVAPTFRTISILARSADAAAASPRTTNEWAALSDEIANIRVSGRLAFLIGSGVSQFSPANVPTGEMITASLRRALLSALPSDYRARVDYLTSGIPFEVIMTRLTEISAERAQTFISDVATAMQPNDIHRQIAHCMLGHPRAVFAATTNYDRGLSSAIHELEWRAGAKPAAVAARSDVCRLEPEQSLIFHLHGATAGPVPLVFDYNAEFQLPRWKREFLHRRLAGRTLLVMGFSGRDLDVTEVLHDARLSRVIWVYRTLGDCDSQPPWPVAVLRDRVPTVAVNADGRLDLVLRQLSPAVAPRLKVDMPQLQARITGSLAKLGPWLGLWARWMGIRAGCPELARNLPKSEADLLNSRLRLELDSFGDFYSGKYSTGAQKQARAASLAKSAGDMLGYTYHRNNEAEFYNRAGMSARSLAALLRAVIAAGPDHRRGAAEGAEFRNLVSTFLLTWPIPSVYLALRPVHRIVLPLFRATAKFNRRGDLDKFLLMNLVTADPRSPEYARAEERYRWLGQNARLINLNRISALRQLFLAGSHQDAVDLARAWGRAYRATQWAALVGDPGRLGKSWLVWKEVDRVLRNRVADYS